MKDLNFFPFDIESNIYNTTVLNFDHFPHKLLVGTKDCSILCIDYDKFKPRAKDVDVTYLPSGSKIISLEALKRGPNDFAVGVAYSLTPTSQKQTSRNSISGQSIRDVATEYIRLTSYYLNIFADNSGENTNQFDLEKITQNCQTIKLDFTPYQLFRTELITNLDIGTGFEKRPLWLLGGGDSIVHAYFEDEYSHSFNEILIEDSFPELLNVGAIVLWIDAVSVEFEDHYERMTALAFENGSVKLFHSVLTKSKQTFELVKTFSFDDYTTIIPTVRFFKIQANHKSEVSEIFSTHRGEPVPYEKINLIALSSTNPSIVFDDVFNFGLESRYELPNSQRADSSVCLGIGDTNMDGLNELLIGTYGREMLVYTFDEDDENYQLREVIELNQPLYSISVFNLSGDILKEVVIMVVDGILVKQGNIDHALSICRRRLGTLLSILDV